MRRPGLGISGIQKQQQASENFRETGQALASSQIHTLKEQYQLFKNGLERFAKEHGSKIKKDPLLRLHFTQMCQRIGVDPLASGRSSKLFGAFLGLGDFYYELGVQCIEACIKLKDDGNLIDIQLVKAALTQMRKEEISQADIEKAIETIKPLKSGLKVITMGTKCMIQAIPMEISNDQMALLQTALERREESFFDEATMSGWPSERFMQAKDQLMQEGLIWLDSQSKPISYWIPPNPSQATTEGL